MTRIAEPQVRIHQRVCLSREFRARWAKWPGNYMARANGNSSLAGPIVRIHLPPADSPSLAGFLLTVSKSRQLPRRARARPGGTAGRDAPGSSTSRQLPVMSLSDPIPVPQCRLGGSRPWLHGCAKRGRVSDVTGSGFGPAQAKPSAARCACQVSGRRECARSLSAVRSCG